MEGTTLFGAGMHAVTRGMASESHFQNELQAYMSLKELQGKEIAEFLGHFTLEFDDRELHEDGTCRVMILEQIKGPLLATVPASRLSSDQLSDIRDQVLRIVDIVLNKDIYFPVLYLDTFKITKVDDKIRVMLFSFGTAFDPKERYVMVTKRDNHARITRETVEDILEEMGFMP
jgi:hypothetical protein